MGLASETWEKIKAAARAVRPIVYEQKNGKEIKFRAKPPKVPLSTKHEASKRGFQHSLKNGRALKLKARYTNHERVQLARAHRLGISITEYRRRYCQ